MIYEAVEAVLTALDEQGSADSDDWEARVQAALGVLEGDYKKLTDAGRAPIDYSDLAAQAAYVFRYVYGHAEFIYDFLVAARNAIGSSLFDDDVLVVSSIGGGPGSELLGLLKYLNENHGEPEVSKIVYTILDREPNWEHVVEAFAEHVNAGIEIEVIFQQVDVSAAALPAYATLNQEELVFMCFFVSEICTVAPQKNVTPNIRALLRTLPKGKLLVYKDSKTVTFLKYLRGIMQSTGGFSELFEVDNQFSVEAPEYNGTVLEYINHYNYGQKLNSNAVSKVFRRI